MSPETRWALDKSFGAVFWCAKTAWRLAAWLIEKAEKIERRLDLGA